MKLVKITSHRNGSLQPTDLHSRNIAALRGIESTSTQISRYAHETLPVALRTLSETLREALSFINPDSTEKLKFLCRVASNIQAVRQDVEDCVIVDAEKGWLE
jgi:hypothetical protein